MGYSKYLTIRLINALLVLTFVTFVVSILFVKVSEDEAVTRIAEVMNNEARNPAILRLKLNNPEEFEKWKSEREAQLKRQFELDKPFWQRVISKTYNTITLNFGKARSPVFGEIEVSAIIGKAIPRTVLLFTTAQIIITVFGILLGVKAAQQAGKFLDKILSVLAMLTSSLPMWWVGMLFILFFSFQLKLFPASSLPGPELTGFAYIKDLLWRMILPLTTVVFVSFGGWAYTTRNIMIGTMQEDFITVARAKGVPENKVIYGHALRAASPPILTNIIIGLVFSLSGAIITEAVFNWPGMGRLYWVALQQSETNLLMGVTYVTVALFLISMILADLAYAYLDPRVKVGT
jgi:peptide/nickel transport system permease protein